eukprot:1184599-Prorocentrum_minimum.AAC.7
MTSRTRRVPLLLYLCQMRRAHCIARVDCVANCGGPSRTDASYYRSPAHLPWPAHAAPATTSRRAGRCVFPHGKHLLGRSAVPPRGAVVWRAAAPVPRHPVHGSIGASPRRLVGRAAVAVAPPAAGAASPAAPVAPARLPPAPAVRARVPCGRLVVRGRHPHHRAVADARPPQLLRELRRQVLGGHRHARPGRGRGGQRRVVHERRVLVAGVAAAVGAHAVGPRGPPQAHAERHVLGGGGRHHAKGPPPLLAQVIAAVAAAAARHHVVAPLAVTYRRGEGRVLPVRLLARLQGCCTYWPDAGTYGCMNCGCCTMPPKTDPNGAFGAVA